MLDNPLNDEENRQNLVIIDLMKTSSRKKSNCQIRFFVFILNKIKFIDKNLLKNIMFTFTNS